MKREVIFTVECRGMQKDICVSLDILVFDLRTRLCSVFGATDTQMRIFSLNHGRYLDDKNTLYDEKIWDGEILRMEG